MDDLQLVQPGRRLADVSGSIDRGRLPGSGRMGAMNDSPDSELRRGPWAMSMGWHDLLFLHWPVPIEALRPAVPAPLELEHYDGQAWLGVVPFRMSGVRARLTPAVPGVAAFPELNLRTYVRHGGHGGVFFFSLDAHQKVAVRVARATFGLPYFDARMHCRTDAAGWIEYASQRTHRGAPPPSSAAATDRRARSRWRCRGPWSTS